MRRTLTIAAVGCVVAVSLWAVAASFITFTAGTAPSNPASGKMRLWANSSSGNLECLNSSGGACVWGGEKRICSIVVGSDNGSALANADIGPQAKQCKIADASTVLEVDVAADAGTPSVTMAVRHCTTFTANVCSAETVSNLVSSALATASGFDACSKLTAVTGLDGGTTCSATLQNTALAAGDWIELVSGTAGGTAKRMSVDVVYTVN